MDIVVEPEMYTANIDNEGNYIDWIPSFHSLTNGIRCPCGSRKDSVFRKYSSFSAHIKTTCHRKWLDVLNTNRQNFYKECEDMKTTITNQRLIIARLEKDLNLKNNTIDQLTHHNQLIKEKYECVEKSVVCNLLDLDL